MKVLIGCEFSGIVREAFKARGHYAVSCDLLPTEIAGLHYQGDVFDIIEDDWDLAIFHPPCTYLTVTANRWHLPEYKNRYPDRERQREEAIDFFMRLTKANIPRIAIENPVGIMSTRFKKPTQIIQPYEFGHRIAKKTCLWLKSLPSLKPTNIVSPEYVVYKSKTKKSGISKYNKLWHDAFPHRTGSKERSRLFTGIAEAMAEQWSREENQLRLAI